jgi:hypothetical protein
MRCQQRGIALSDVALAVQYGTVQRRHADTIRYFFGRRARARAREDGHIAEGSPNLAVVVGQDNVVVTVLRSPSRHRNKLKRPRSRRTEQHARAVRECRRQEQWSAAARKALDATD